MDKQLIITNQIIQDWIDIEKQMAIYDGDDHPAVISHNHIGKVIFGDNLSKAKAFIYENSEKQISQEDLQNLINN
jgi:hypothetical protein